MAAARDLPPSPAPSRGNGEGRRAAALESCAMPDRPMPARGAPASAAVAPGEPPLAHAPEGVPDFFIVGHQKCGTSALLNKLTAP